MVSITQKKSALIPEKQVYPKTLEIYYNIIQGIVNKLFCILIFFNFLLDFNYYLGYNNQVAIKYAARAQEVERILGKDEVTSSTLVSSSKNPVHVSGRDFYFLLLTSSLLPQNIICTGFLETNNSPFWYL